jgi:hypothetical protein
VTVSQILDTLAACYRFWPHSRPATGKTFPRRAIRADAEAEAARKAGDRDRAERQETLATSYRALRHLYQQREQALAQAMADRQDWEHTTVGSRRLAIAADAELRRRHPGQMIEPPRSAEPVPVTDTERDGKPSKTATRIGDLAAQHHAFRERIGRRQRRMTPREDVDRAGLGDILPSWWALGVWSVSLNHLRFDRWFHERNMMSNKPHRRPHQKKRQASQITRLLVAILVITIFALAIALEATGRVVFRGRLILLSGSG